MNEKLSEMLKGIEIPDELLEGIAGGVMSADDVHWAESMMKGAKNRKMTLDELLDLFEASHSDAVRSGADSVIINLLSESMDYIRQNW